jgi:phenol 2-monooxygenase
MFSGQIGALDSSEAKNLTHEEFLEIFLEGSGFTSGCGIEYPKSCLVKSTPRNAGESKDLISGTDYLGGNLKAGRRINDCIVKRYADANPRHIQDGEFGLILLVSGSY